jgi:hypothetical protein
MLDLEAITRAENEKNTALRDALDHIRGLVSKKIRDPGLPMPPLDALKNLAPSGSAEDRATFVPMSLLMCIAGMMDTVANDEPPLAGDCVAAIRRALMWPSPGHAFCAVVLTDSQRRLKEAVNRLGPGETVLKFHSPGQELSIVDTLNHLIYAVSKLERLSVYANQLLKFTLVTEHWAGFFRGHGAESCTGEILRLAEIAHRARSERELPRSDVDALSRVCDSLLTRLWGRKRPRGLPTEPESPFFNFIAAFECEIFQLLNGAVASALDRIEKERRIRPPLAAIGRSWEGMVLDKSTQRLVLCDRELLLMACDNYISNFRYSVAFEEALVSGFIDTTIGSISVEGEDEDDHVWITFRSPGVREGTGPGSSRRTTTADHARRLTEFGCQLREWNEEGNYIVELQFTRINHKRGGERDATEV